MTVKFICIQSSASQRVGTERTKKFPQISVVSLLLLKPSWFSGSCSFVMDGMSCFIGIDIHTYRNIERRYDRLTPADVILISTNISLSSMILKYEFQAIFIYKSDLMNFHSQINN